MSVIRRDVPPLTAWRCLACGQLHRDFDRECMYECGAELEEVEVVPADIHAGAVEENASLRAALTEIRDAHEPDDPIFTAAAAALCRPAVGGGS